MEKLYREAFHDGAQAFDSQLDAAIKSGKVVQLTFESYQADLDAVTGENVEIILPSDPNASSVRTEPHTVATVEDPRLIPPSNDSETFFQVNEDRLDVIIRETMTDMEQAQTAAINKMGADYERAIKKADIALATGSVTMRQAIDQATRELLTQGLNCVQYKDGKRVNLASYIEMVLRTGARRSMMTAEGAKRDELGIHTVISPTLHSTCGVCQKWQNVVLIDDVYSGGVPDGETPLLSEAVREGFLHPNCRHPIVTYIEGVTQKATDSPYDKTKRQYEAEERQRYIERAIRRYKRLAEGSTDEDNVKKYKVKLKEWQGNLREHLRDNPQLRRQVDRETDISA